MATTTRTKSRSAAKPKVDVYQVVTDQVLEMLEAGTAPWHQPWDAIGGAPISMSTKKPYRGINTLLLQMTAMAKGYSSPWWGTYKNISERGGQVRKGEKGTQIVLWKPLLVEDEKKPGEKKQIWMLRTYTVFNAQQADGDLGLPKVEARPQVEAIEECEAALAAYYLTGPKLRFTGDHAFYTPGTDAVTMPKRNQFHSPEEFYGTWFHETTHSTGHKDRLGRKGITELGINHKFGDESYAQEELVAEMGAAFLSARTGIAAATLPNSAAYLANWIEVLKNDKKMLVSAAQQAQKAVDLILGDAVAVDAADDTEAPATDDRVAVSV